MFLLKLMIKLILFPVICLLTLIEWIGIFLTEMSSVIIGLLSGLIFLTALLSFMMKLASGQETLAMAGGAFLLFVIPFVGEWVIARIALLNEWLKSVIRS